MRLTHLLLGPSVAIVAASGTARADRLVRGDDEAVERVALVELIESAVRRSPELSMARADHAEARDRIAAAELVDQWRVVGRVNGQDTATSRALASPGVALDTRSYGAELGLQRSLSTGGEITVAVATSDVENRYATVAGLAMTAQAGDAMVGGTIASARLGLSHHLLQGRGSGVARADQKLARLAGRTLSAQADDDAAKLVHDLVVDYWELVYATEALAVDREGEALAAHQVAITHEIVRAGLQPTSAVKLAELQVALRQEAILRDEATRYDQSLALRQLAGLELGDAPLAPIEATDAIAAPPADRVESEVIAEAVAHGPGTVQKRLGVRGADIAIDVASSGTLPRLDLSVTGELSGVGASAGDAFGRIGDGQMYTVMAGLTLVWEIGGAASAAEAGARVHRVRMDSARTELDQQLEVTARSAVSQLHRARKRVELSRLAVEVADEALRTEVAAFQAGRSTNVVVFQREDDVAQAKLRLARARIDAVEADCLIDYVTGALLSRYGVKVTDPRAHA